MSLGDLLNKGFTKLREKDAEWKEEHDKGYDEGMRLSDRALISRIKSSRGFKKAGFMDAARDRGLMRDTRNRDEEE